MRRVQALCESDKVKGAHNRTKDGGLVIIAEKGTGTCYRCGYCCRGQFLVPKDEEADLNPAFLATLALLHGDAFAAGYEAAHSRLAGDECPWLTANPDGMTTSCRAYERRPLICRVHNADTACVVGYMVMRQYGCFGG